MIAASAVVISGCSVGNHLSSQAPLKNTTEGFNVFHGRCINSDATMISPALIPLMTNIVAGGIKLAGTTLKKYGEDIDAKFATTVNFDGDESLSECLHVVYGKVYTDKTDFIDTSQSLGQILPLPWNSIARASLEDNATSKQISDQTQATLSAAKNALASSGAMIADKPSLFAELRILRSTDKSNISLRLRAFYYGAPLADSWFTRNNPKAIIISISPFDPSKALLDNLKNGYSIPFYKVPIGSAWVSRDLLYPAITAPQSWETPYYPISSLGKKPLTLVVGLLETTAGSQLLTVLGTALEGTADITAEAIVDEFDKQKRTANEANEKAEIDKARTDSATATAKAITNLGKANDTYDSCVTLLASSNGALTKPQRDAVLAFASARVIAAASIAAAEPTISALKLNTSIIADPGMCVMP